MIKSIFLYSLLIVLFVACSATTRKDDHTKTNNIDAKAKGGNNCLLGYAEKYDELLTKEMVARASGVPADEMIITNSKIHTSTKYHKVSYGWKSGRIKKIGGVDVPVDDYVELTGIDPISLDRFQMSYKAVTAKETATMKKNINNVLEGTAADKKVQEKLKKLEEMGVSKEAQKKMMEGLTNSAQKMTEGFTAVQHLGDAATWNTKTNTMYVFDNGAMFALVVDTKDKANNKAIATTLSQKILDKCK